MTSWAVGRRDYRTLKKTCFVNHIQKRHLSERVKITTGEWILRVIRPNGECCQNVVSNTVTCNPLESLSNLSLKINCGKNSHTVGKCCSNWETSESFGKPFGWFSESIPGHCRNWHSSNVKTTTKAIDTLEHRPWSAQYLAHEHSHITRTVATMDSRFGLVGPHQHGIAVSCTARRVQSTPLSASSTKHMWELEAGNRTACVEKVDQPQLPIGVSVNLCKDNDSKWYTRTPTLRSGQYLTHKHSHITGHWQPWTAVSAFSKCRDF